MKIADLKNKLTGKKPAADPAQAFGSEQQTMEEIRRQTFHRPAPKPAVPNVAQKAGAVLSDLKNRFAASPAPEQAPPPIQQPAEEPRYAEAPYTPEPGWQNPFYAPASAPRARRSAAPVQPEYYPPQPEYTAPPEYYPPQPEYYPPQQPEYYPPQPDFAPNAYASYDAYAPMPEYNAPPEYYSPEQPTGYAPPAYTTGEPYRPARPVRQKEALKPGELKYYLWSGAIVGGLLLTLISFIYACAI